MERTRISTHIILICGAMFMTLPVWIAFATSTHAPETILREGLQFWPGGNFLKTYKEVLFVEGGVMKKVTAITMLKNSLILGIGFAVGKVIVSMLAAYAIVYFRFRFAVPLFWVIFMTLLLPLEVRIIPSYKVVADLGLLDAGRSDYPVDCVCDWHVLLSPVLPLRTRRIARGCTFGRGNCMGVFQGHPCAT
jgi:sn-glycerol 3-phosphate transport system permease protein